MGAQGMTSSATGARIASGAAVSSLSQMAIPQQHENKVSALMKSAAACAGRERTFGVSRYPVSHWLKKKKPDARN